MKPWVALALPIILLAGPAMGQHTHHEEPAVSPEKLGRVDFATSCNDAAKPQFDRAMTMLHSFWYSEARKAFQAAAAADPRCGIAWWGVAMTYYHPLWAPPTVEELAAGAEAAKKAKAAGGRTARERDYINAIAEFYRQTPPRDVRQRARDFESSMAKLQAKYPDDLEAAVFHALTLDAVASPTDKSYANQRKAGGILEPIFATHPDHPGLAHYIIHSYDYPALASMALPAARVYAKIAPDSPHALHMPSHIFVRLGLWDEAVSSNLDSAEAARKFVATHAPGAASFDELHAYDYLVYAWLQTGEDEKAANVVQQLGAIERVDAQELAAAYALAAIPTRFALERRDWKAARDLRLVSAGMNWEKFPQAAALVSFANAVGAAHLGDKEAAAAAVARLAEIERKLRERPDPYWATQVEVSRLAAEGWLACAAGNEEQATLKLRAAAELEESTEKHPVTPGSVLPAREMVADHLLTHGHGAEALEAYERSLQNAANRLNALSGAAHAAQIAGDRKKAAEYYLRTAALLTHESQGEHQKMTSR